MTPRLIVTLIALSLSSLSHAASLRNASYDVAREFYKDYNSLFIHSWNQQHKEPISIEMSHGGSSKQARAVIDGLEADVVSMNQTSDVDAIAKAGLIQPDWTKRLPYNSAPFSSTTVFVVRHGNPKAIKDWPDLIKPGIQNIIPNPKTSGNGRYTYLAAWAYALKQPNGNDGTARNFVSQLFKQVPVLDTGGRGATTSFAQRDIGDVLITFENEAYLLEQEFGAGQFEIVYPSSGILAELPVSVVDKVVDKRQSRPAAEAYVQALFAPAAQELAVKHHLRPKDPDILAKHQHSFKSIKLYRIEDIFGSWPEIQKTHFADAGLFDQIYQPGSTKP